MPYSGPARVPKARPRTVEVWLPGDGPPDVFEAYPVATHVWQDTQGRLFISIDGEKDPAPYEASEWVSFSFIDAAGDAKVEVWNVRYAAKRKEKK